MYHARSVYHTRYRILASYMLALCSVRRQPVGLSRLCEGGHSMCACARRAGAVRLACGSRTIQCPARPTPHTQHARCAPLGATPCPVEPCIRERDAWQLARSEKLAWHRGSVLYTIPFCLSAFVCTLAISNFAIFAAHEKPCPDFSCGLKDAQRVRHLPVVCELRLSESEQVSAGWYRFSLRRVRIRCFLQVENFMTVKVVPAQMSKAWFQVNGVKFFALTGRVARSKS